MKQLALILALTQASPLAAQSMMSAAEFDAYTRGKTERYLSNRRVEWSFLDGECKSGSWYEDAGKICFTYDENPTPQCWRFREGASGLIAQFENDPTTTELYEAQNSGQDFTCLGPKVGV